ncbi:NAD-dependent epimerase/dehydratase family protein [Oleiharenicola sp. Vm1]|uniref:NAD-dependent epimerase/dehydratase family protein n=1 Tax=Oleiharenicola sp. Vm1 TaxID=3398393 RepID=UPI0039F5A83D
MVYLVTGAAGFIASKVCERLLADGHTVVGVDNLNDYYDPRLKDYRLARLLGATEQFLPGAAVTSRYAGRAVKHGRFHFRALDLEDLAALEALFTEFPFDAVFNLAARAGVRFSLENPHVYLSTNAHGTLNVMEAMRRHGVRKQVLASTSSLYAGCPMPFTEDQPVNTPLSPYAATKKAAELMAYTYHKLYGLDTTVVRYFTVFGPAGRPDMAPFRFIEWITRGQPIELFGDGTQARDFTFVDDIAHGTVLAAKPVGYEIVNLGGGNNPVSLHAIIGCIESALGRKARLVGRPPHAADMQQTWADITKAGRLLGWRPQVSVEEGFRRTVAWHREHAAWLAQIRL